MGVKAREWQGAAKEEEPVYGPLQHIAGFDNEDLKQSNHIGLVKSHATPDLTEDHPALDQLNTWC
ncbi:hypothetical protein PCANC_00887 [Puccinia coronata f. sp. avenae]|uniref:Uncharacterized protein n=1 Tax=Puccinia coronata f. sp. avenae TaxID=200324 RepID=A0A2N5W7F4_9BASI|nr:hypothetical protein PCANC_14663 [Puccinia coronata f. sp. avenae]PLW48051.1 hypothetical protein PCASD_03595 [Puccinia coronata f. sp. avenae]PLW58173.1 hypothetical protein PCANC_00887 [Puccinia coronata f. sp. avenae]